MKVNMYGCTACPQCESPYRCIFADRPDVIVCGDCGREDVKVPGENFSEDYE